ncbi:MAG TPA: hypothetical protein VIN59_04130 [Alphaproteobacteria bacterium]
MTRESKQAQALLRVFESLAVPLMGAVDEVLSWSGNTGDTPTEETARQFASLLSSSIATGTQMAGKLNAGSQEDLEAARLKTSSLAAQVIAQHYALTGQMPDDEFNQRLMDAYNATLSLAGSFSYPGDDNNDPADPVAARTLALAPFVAAVMRFPFGQTDDKLIRRLGEDLCERASNLTEAFSVGQPRDETLYAARELSFLKGCAGLLARACDIEMNRLNGQDPDPEALLDAVWKRFEDGLDVLRAVIGFAVDPNMQSGASDTAPAIKTAPRGAVPAQKPMQEAPAQEGPFNPMAFFSKPQDGKQAAGGAK